MLRLDINLVFTIVNIVVLYICMRLFFIQACQQNLKAETGCGTEAV